MKQKKHTPDTSIYYYLTEQDEELAAIRLDFEEKMKESGAVYFGPHQAAEILYQLGRALSGNHPMVQRWLNTRKVRR